MHDNWLDVAKGQLTDGHLQPAYNTALARLGEERDDGDAWGMMALIAMIGGNRDKADELFARATALGMADVRLRAARARHLLDAANAPAARAIALSFTPDQARDAFDADTIGVLLVRTGCHSEALPFLRQAVAAAPDNPQYRYNLATAQQFAGDLAQATVSYRQVLAHDPGFHRATLALAQLGDTATLAPEQVAAAFEAQPAKDAEARLALGHAAAALAERAGDDRAALAWLDRAKQAKARATRFDRPASDALFAAAERAAAARSPCVTAPSPPPPAPAPRPSASPSAMPAADPQPAPLFIIGMPRSGTTLVERIVSSHSAVVSAGELSDFAIALKRDTASAGPYVLDAATLAAPYDPARVGAAYAERTAAPAPPGTRFRIDKMPFNLFFVAHILAALPRARIVMVRRDARDTVFANYRQLFASRFGYYDYAYDLADTAWFVARFNRLAEHLHAACDPARYTQIRYEALIAGQERESRRLTDWLGLDWEAQCLDFHTNSAPVATASSVQVRAPIHARSVARWRRYGEAGMRVDAMLRQHGWDEPEA